MNPDGATHLHFLLEEFALQGQRPLNLVHVSANHISINSGFSEKAFHEGQHLFYKINFYSKVSISDHLGQPNDLYMIKASTQAKENKSNKNLLGKKMEMDTGSNLLAIIQNSITQAQTMIIFSLAAENKKSHR